MNRIAVAGLLCLFALGACATAETKKSFTPKTVVVVKGAAKRTAEANYQVSPESKRTGSGGSAK